MIVNIIGVPTFYGCDKNGPQFGPKKLREKNLIDTIKKYDNNVYDLGDINIENISDSLKLNDNCNMKYYNQILDTNTNLACSVFNSLSSNSFPLIIGGDHSIASGSIAGISKYFNNLGVVWFDAHGDINTPQTSDSKNVHGMPLAACMGYGDDKFVNLYFDGIKVKEENVFHIGGRDLDDGEKDLLNKTNMVAYDPYCVRTNGLDFVIDDIVEKALEQNIDALHISFDLDFIDEKFVPGTGTRVSNGFSVEEAKYLLTKLSKCGLVKSMDLVELNPLLDEADVTADIAIDVIDTVFAALNDTTEKELAQNI